MVRSARHGPALASSAEATAPASRPLRAPDRSTRPGGRVHGLDALRAGALLLGIVLHSLMPYVGGGWLINDPASSAVACPTIATIHLFRMTLFMMLAGFFGRMMVHRRGAGPYVVDRLTRITLPLVVFWPFVVLPLGLIAAVAASHRGLPVPAPPADASVLVALTPGQLWFLALLTQAVLVTMVLRAVARRVVGADRASAVARCVGWWLVAPGGVLLAAVPYAVGLVTQGTLVGGLQAPLTVVGSPSAFIAHVGAFWVGWAVHAADGLDGFARRWAPHLAVALVLTVIAGRVEGAPLVVGAGVTAVAGWAWVFALTGWCVRHFGVGRAWVRYVADASYWMYLVHLPLVLGLGALLLNVPWPALVKSVVVLGLTVPVLLGTYELWVRHTWVGAWLNGRRR